MKQLIFVVETNKDVKSDEIYIKSILNHHYDLMNNNTVRVQFVYMDGKTKYQNKKSSYLLHRDRTKRKTT